MRTYALAILGLIVAGCGGNGSTSVTPSSTPPDSGGGSNGGGGGMPGGGGGGGGGMPGGGGGGGGMPGGGGGGGGMPGGGGGGGGAACTDTQPVVITTEGRDAVALAVDDSDVYFTALAPNASMASAWRAPLSGGPAVEVGTSDAYVLQITVNATAFFTADVAGRVLRWPKGGGAPLELRAAGGALRRGCFADAFGYLYWCTDDTNGGQVVRTPEDGGGPATVIATTVGLNQMAFDPQHLWYNGAHDIFAIAPDGSAGSSMTIPWNGTDNMAALAVDDTHVFASSSFGQLLVADKRDGASLQPLVTPSPGFAGQLLVDGGNLYAKIDPADVRNRYSSIKRFSTDGSSMTTLVGMAGTIGQMAIRGPYIYFAHVDDSTVYRVCK